MTSRLARKIIEDEARKLREKGFEADVFVMNANVAALVPVEKAAEEVLEELGSSVQRYDAVIVSGMAPGDARKASEILGVPVLRGPRHASDLSLILGYLGLDALSPDRPADEVASELLEERLLKVVSELEARCTWGLGLPVRPPPLRVIAEVFSVDEAVKAWERGADLVCVARPVGSPDQSLVKSMVKRVVDSVDCPVAIDTPFESEARAAVEAGAELVLSVTPESIHKYEDLRSRAAFVLIPEHREPKALAVEELAAAAPRLRDKGYRVILDPVLEPPLRGLLESLQAYSSLSSRIPWAPMLMGIGNAYELMDADTPGCIALLASLALEAGASALLVTEASCKAKGALAEAVVAAAMISAAAYMNRPPKDLGLSLLVLKEKRQRKPGDLQVSPNVRHVWASELSYKPVVRDYVKLVCSDEGARVLHVSRSGSTLIEARDPLEALKALQALRIPGTVDHALYVGFELGKAYAAWRLGKSYVQDEDLQAINVEEAAKRVARAKRAAGRSS